MRHGILMGMAIGAILGAMFVEGNAPAAEMVQKSKKAVKNKVDCMTNAAANAIKTN